jgi:L-lactate dehydrogenase complex protein LldE
VKHESISVGMAEQKVTDAEDTGADYLISTDMSCLMHLEGYIKRQQRPMKVMHLIDALAEGWD